MDKDRFIALWGRCVGVSGGSDNEWFVRAREVFKRVESHYREPHRHYHNVNHIDHCLRQFDLAKDLYDPEESDKVEMAVWFHDVIYEVGGHDNELNSANWFRKMVNGSFDTQTVDEIVDLILVTQHQKMPEKNTGKFVVDVDLSSLGMPWAHFVEDSTAVRDEWPDQSDGEFFRGQMKFFQYLLNRPSIYSTPFYFARLEDTARKNLERKLGDISQLV